MGDLSDHVAGCTALQPGCGPAWGRPTAWTSQSSRCKWEILFQLSLKSGQGIRRRSWGLVWHTSNQRQHLILKSYSFNINKTILEKAGSN